MTRLARTTRALAHNYLFRLTTVYAIGVATGAIWYSILA